MKVDWNLFVGLILILGGFVVIYLELRRHYFAMKVCFRDDRTNWPMDQSRMTTWEADRLTEVRTRDNYAAWRTSLFVGLLVFEIVYFSLKGLGY